MFSLDLMEDSLSRSLLMVAMSLTAHSTIGCMRNPPIRYGTYHKRCTDGSDGTTAAMSSSLISLRLDGTTSQIVDSILSQILPMENTHQSMCITTICTPMHTRSQDRHVERMVLLMANSSQLDSSHLRTNGSENRTSKHALSRRYYFQLFKIKTSFLYKILLYYISTLFS